MPIYSYKCECGAQFERHLPLARYQDPQTCDCGQAAKKVLTAVSVMSDYAGYNCPVSGKWVEGRKAHRENLAKHGCRVYEAGETEQFKARCRAEEAAAEEAMCETAASFVEGLSGARKEQLGRELESGADISVTRT